MNNILPVLNVEQLQQKANEFAQKGAEECIKEFYTGYNSAYKKSIEENLKGKTISDWPLGLPDIVGVLNEKIIAEFDDIANTAIAQTLIPYAKELLNRTKDVVPFSEILAKFIESEYDKEDDDSEDFICEVSKSNHGWLNVVLSNSELSLDLTLHTKKEAYENPTYQILSLPRDNSKNYGRNMVVKVGDVSIEMPITTGLLKNKFTAFVASMLISRSEIIMDVTDFDEDMFPKDHCHC
jgi:hypothetical protein